LRCEYYRDSLQHTKFLLEEGIVKWTEYEDQYQEATDWLSQTETNVQGFNKLVNSLEEKKTVLEQFQMQLQTVFDWQKELDRLNMKAQLLLETCADSRISNAVTQMTTKYNTLLSLAKEVMRRLELHYQVHEINKIRVKNYQYLKTNRSTNSITLCTKSWRTGSTVPRRRSRSAKIHLFLWLTQITNSSR
jgi:DNA repair ATPase RecN